MRTYLNHFSIPAVVAFLSLYGLSACSQPADPLSKYPHLLPYERIWVWNLDVGHIDTQLKPYPNLTPENPEFNQGDVRVFDMPQRRNVIKALSDLFKRRFIAWGFIGDMRIRLPYLDIDRISTETGTRYTLRATVYIKVEYQDLFHEELWPLNTSVTFAQSTPLTAQEESTLFERMLDRLVRQAQDASGDGIHKVLDPLRLDP